MKIHAFNVVPSLPESLKALRGLAYNLRWTWDPEILSLFARLDLDLWDATNHNPVKMLGMIDQKKLLEAAQDDGFLAHLERACESFRSYMSGRHWFGQTYANHPDNGSALKLIAYFSAEFGLSESVPIYSGGLGVLAGDHLKAASDLGVPLVGVSLLYRQGYFRQYLNADGWQQEYYPENDFYNLPVTMVRDESGQPVVIEVEFPGRMVHAQVWKLDVGRTELYLLDTSIEPNSAADKEISATLYGGDQEMRIKQEILLGIGGVRVMHALGMHPDVYHMNEGHSAFLALERIRAIMESKRVSFAVARQAVTASTVFTTHTPVPAGNDTFPAGMVERYFRGYAEAMGISIDEFLALGRQNPHDRNEGFCMTILALNLSASRNGVSELHGEVSRRLWRGIWPNVREEEVPIGAITNGIHTRSWISHEMGALYDRYLGPSWTENPADQSVWKRAEEIPDAELWRTHERRRERLVAYARRHLREQLIARGAPESEVARADEVLDSEALTIGFARRFAMYKRGTLLLRDAERLKRLLMDKDRPMQIIFAGKSHPADNGGKELIRQLIHFMRDPAIRNRVVFVEDYDINVARYMVQGVDVWLNTPRRPLEACGTSGMKAAANGALNLSILDGWWCEGYAPECGWAIGRGEEYNDYALQDDIESAAMFDLLEKEVIPLFYTRSADDLPRQWISRMKSGMRRLCSQFNANRMVKDYLQKAYLEAAKSGARLLSDNLAASAELAQWKERVQAHWSQVDLRNLSVAMNGEVRVGEVLPVEATIHLGAIHPEDVLVQVYQGHLTSKQDIEQGTAYDLSYERSENGIHVFKGGIPCMASGRFGFALRIVPRHEGLASPFDSKLVYWA